MIALLQATSPAEGVFIPAWMLAVFGAFLLALLGIIGWFIQNMVADLKTVIEGAVAAFQSFKEEAPKEFVTHPFLDLALKGQSEDTGRAHKRINELKQELGDHRKDPVAHGFRAAEGR